MSIKKHLSLGFILFCILFVAGCANKKVGSSTQKLSIVTTTDFYGEVAKKVVGNKGTVTSIINNPAIDPHDYEPTTKVAKKVSQADIVIANGLGYDAWMNKLSKKNPQNYIKIGEDIRHQKVGDNPHIWYDPQTMPKYANYLAKQLGKKDPKHRAYFEQNAKDYIATLKPVQTELTKLKQASNSLTNKKVYVSEPVFDYSIQATGFKVANQSFENAVEKGTDPTPSVIKKMHQGIKQKQIAFFVLNSQTDSKLVTNLVSLAKQNHVPVLKVTETLPKGKDYKQWMLSQYQDLNKILQSEQ